MYESKSVIFLLLFFLLAPAITAASTTKAIKFRLWDGHSVINNAVVVADNNKITSVTANGRVPAGGRSNRSRYHRRPQATSAGS